MATKSKEMSLEDRLLKKAYIRIFGTGEAADNARYQYTSDQQALGYTTSTVIGFGDEDSNLCWIVISEYRRAK